MLMICLLPRSPSMVTLRLVYSSAYGMASKIKKPEKKNKGRWSWCTPRCILHHAPCQTPPKIWVIIRL
ncbi:hypothetical protein HYDPIDRAFT_120081, partial [Hydnomerulius pinastri MD-312]